MSEEENTETLVLTKASDGWVIIVQHDQTGSAYDCPLSESAYLQLKQHFEKVIYNELPANDKVTEAATQYAEQQMDCYTNDLYGFEAGVKWVRDEFIRGIVLCKICGGGNTEEQDKGNFACDDCGDYPCQKQ